MKQVTITQLKQLTAKEIKDGGCFEIVADGEHVAFIVVGAIEEMRDRIVVAMGQIDASRDK